MISDLNNSVLQQGIKPQSFAIKASIITVRPLRTSNHCHINHSKGKVCPYTF